MPKQDPKVRSRIVWCHNESAVHVSMTAGLINKELANLFQLRIGNRGRPLVQHSFTAYQGELRFYNSKGLSGCVVIDD